MNFKPFTLLGIGLMLTSVCWTSRAAIIADWSFETSIPTSSGSFSPEVGTGSALGYHAGSATYSNPTGNGSAESFSANTWSLGDFWQFTASTIGCQNIVISFDAISSSTGPRDFKLVYDFGDGFADFTTYALLNNNVSSDAWIPGTHRSGSEYSFDLSAITGLNDNSSVTFRLIDTSTVSAGVGIVAGTGTSRVDNFTISGDQVVTAVPEASTLLAGLLLLVPFGLQGIRYLRNRTKTC